MSTAPNVQRRKMQLICKASATERSCSVNRPAYSGYRSKGRLCARAATSGRRPVPLLWGEPAGPGRPRGEHRRADLFFRGLPRSFYLFAAASPRGLRARSDKVCVSPAFRKTAPAALGRAFSPKIPGRGTTAPARYCPRVAQLPRHTAPARSVPLRPAPRSRPCAARAQQKRTAEKFRRPFERALSASQKLSTGCRASDSWCAAGDAPFRCPACPDTPCRAG